MIDDVFMNAALAYYELRTIVHRPNVAQSCVSFEESNCVSRENKSKQTKPTWEKGRFWLQKNFRLRKRSSLTLFQMDELEEYSGDGINFIPCIKFVQRGVAKSQPDKVCRIFWIKKYSF